MGIASLLAAVGTGTSVASAGPATAVWPVDGTNDTACVAAAAFAGFYATGDTFQNRVEIRDIRGNLRHAITQSDILALCPWMSLDGGPDGPNGLAFSPSGHFLFILVSDDTVPGDGQPSDAILRYDLSTGALVRQARVELFSRGDIWPHLGAAHYRAYLYAGTGNGTITIIFSGASSANSTPTATWTLPGGAAGGPVHGVTVDRDAGTIYAANDTTIYRATIPITPTITPTFTALATASDIRGLAWGDHYGGSAQRGLYILKGTGPSSSEVDFIPAATAASGSGVTPAFYSSAASVWHSISATADGRLLIGADEDAVMLSDTSDTRLSFDNFLHDEFNQATSFSRGLISPDGEPAGWVIDGDVTPGNSRFHPATPDAAGWTVLMLLVSDRLNADPNAQAQVRTVLTRYAGLAGDGKNPVRNADGIFKHWLDPQTGNTKGTWTDEYATLSTQFIVAGAARAMQYYPDDPAIALAASRIIFRTKNYDAYFQTSNDAMAFKGLAAGGPDTSSWSLPFHEGIIYVEQAGVYGGSISQTEQDRWFTRSNWFTSQYVIGKPITTAVAGQFDAAFLSLFPALLSPLYRGDNSPAGWRTQVDNVRWSNAGFTDDNVTRVYAVFSAGTSPAGGGYNADTLVSHPGNLTTFTSLEALCAFGETSEAVGAYAAYRKGSRQTFKTGASILYRRPIDSGTFVPNSAAVVDVALGGLGLAELIQPGIIDTVLARAYPTAEQCPSDINGDGKIDAEDLYRLSVSPVDLNGDGLAGGADRACLANWIRRHESTDTTFGRR